ncbi:MAG: aminoacetone oxidase family FAD-binding enzyme, partial [Candidatus Pacebacteria bacterium]|nr:aminoacetone oxidase family FAD-binding enzyme [Candidatus Paceibacterota bacterium]
MKKETKYDIAVIGGGPAGMMAAGRAAELGAKVILIDRNDKLGRKLILTGKGRCNITHAEFDDKVFLKEYGKNGKFLFPGFSVFGSKETIEFFEDRGVKTNIERGKRVFPMRGSAINVLNCLISYLKKGKVIIKNKTRIIDAKIEGKRVREIITDGRDKIIADKYILCTGGKSFPQTGSTGDGYLLAKKLGHTIIQLNPAIVPLVTKGKWVKQLAGLSLKNVEITV